MEQTLDGKPLPAQHDRPDYPGWIWTFASVLLGYVIATGAMFALALPFTALGLDDLAFPFGWDEARPDGLWASLAWTGPRAAMALLLTLAIGFAIESRSEWKVHFWPLFAICFVSALVSTDERGSFWLFVLLVVVLRYAVTVPAHTVGRRRAARRSLIALAVLGGALATVTFAYRPLHPLAVDFDGRSSFDVYQPERGAFSFDVELKSPATTRILGATVEARDLAGRAAVVIQLERQGVDEAASMDAFYGPAAGTTLAGDASVLGRLRLAPGTCRDPRTPRAVVAIDALTLRVRTLGVERTQRFAVEPAALLRCR